MIQKFKKKPVVIEALKWDGKNFDEVSNFTHNFHGHKVAYEDAEELSIETGFYHIETLEGLMKASPGDWIIKGVNGEFYPCKPDIFEKTYDVAPPPAVQSDSEVEFGEWQICPVCNGTGQSMNHRNMIPLTTDTCTRCNGEKIIERPSLKTKELREKINQLMESAKEATEFRDELEAETKELKEALWEIEKSLYIGDDLNDKEILHFYVEVVKTIKKEIHKALNNNQ